MKRREFMLAIGGAMAGPLVARAQQPPKTWRRKPLFLANQGAGAS